MVMGLGFVLSFGYWCTDFLVVQRAMAAKSMSAARRTPLIAAIPKMLFPFLVVLPGLIAMVVPSREVPGHLHRPLIPYKVVETSGDIKYDQTGKPELDYDLTAPMLLL